ncbi:hypothetical protein V6N13_048805 [Hibiscus sabdariffa]
MCQPISHGGLGYRPIDKVKNVFLMKIAIQLPMNKNALWVRFLRTKYKCGSGVPLSLRNTSCSRLWKGLNTVWNMVRNNIVWSINSGNDTDFWYDSWLEEIGPLASYASARHPVPTVSATVASMVYQAGQWKWHLFESFLPRDILFRIVVIKPPSFSTIADSIGWCGNRDRRFTIKFAYSLISNAEISPPNPIWKVGNIIEKACFMVGNTVLLSTSHCFSQLDTGVQHATVGGQVEVAVCEKQMSRK